MKFINRNVFVLSVLTNLFATTFRLIAQDTSPGLRDIPNQTIGFDGAFTSILLPVYLIETDGDEVEWSYEFEPSSATDDRPNWSVNAAQFQFSMNITVKVSARSRDAVGEGHMLAAFSGEDVRGLTSAVEVGEDWLYFMTIYGDLEGEEITFKFYDGVEELILPVNTQIDFTPNGFIGDVSNPKILDASFVLLNLSDVGLVQFEVVDASLTFSESVQFTVTDKTETALAASDGLLLTVIDDHTPLLRGIPGQTVSFGEEFQTFDLDDFLTLNDVDEVEFSFDSEDELVVHIDEDHVVTITKPNASFSGSEEVKFTVTDLTEAALHSSSQVIFTVLPEDHNPEIISIPDQKTGLGGTFKNLDLTEYLQEEDGDLVEWSFTFGNNENPENIPSWEVNANTYQFSMTLTASVISLGSMTTGDLHVLAAFSAGEVRGVTQPIEVGGNWVYFLTMYGNETGEPLELKFFDETDQRVLPVAEGFEFVPNATLGNPVNPQELNAGQILLHIESNNVVSAEIVDPEYIGEEPVIFYVKDVNTLHNLEDSDTIRYIITNDPFPQLGDIPDQTINEGESFQTINLGDYLIDFSIADVIWSFSGNNELEVEVVNNLATIQIPDENWFGEERITFISMSKNDTDLIDSDLVVFNVHNINDAPIVTSVPVNNALINENYVYIITAEDLDGDFLSFSASDLPDWLTFKDIGDNSSILLGQPTIDDLGTFTIEITIHDNQGSPISHEFDLTVLEETITDIDDMTDMDVSIYPNPVKGLLKIEWKSGVSGGRTVDVLNIAGTRMLHTLQPHTSQGESVEIDMEGFPTGVYFVEVNSIDKKTVHRVVKK